MQEVRDRGDLQAPRHPEKMIERNIDQAKAEWWRLVTSVNPDMFLEEKTYTVLVGTGEYDLPAAGGADKDFYKDHGVDVYDSGRWWPMRRFQWADRNRLQDAGSDKLSTKWRIMGSKLYLRPSPIWTGDVKLWYIPASPVFASDSDTLDGIAGMEEYIILWCVIRGKLRDRYDARDWITLRLDLRGEIRDVLSDRSEQEPDEVRDVDREHFSSVFELGIPRTP